MKLITLITIILLAINTNSQSIIVNYNLELLPPKGFESLSSDAKNLIYLMTKRVTDYEGQLIITQDRSYYQTITNLPLGDDSTVDVATSFTLNSNDKYYSKENIIYHITEKMITPVTLKYIQNVKWELLNEDAKLIKGIKCYKAVGTGLNIQGKETKVEAYYAPSFPYSYGPVGYLGLPGLILELKVEYIFYTLKDIEKLKKAKLIELPTEETMSLDVFRENLKRAESNLSNNKN